MRRAVILLVSAALLLIGCGRGGDETSAPRDDTTTTATPDTTTAPGAPESDQTRVDKLVLTAADFPPEWRSRNAPVETPEEESVNDRMSACWGMPPAADSETASSQAREFVNGDNLVTIQAAAFRTAELVDKDFAGITDAKNHPCIEDVIRTELSKDAVAGGNVTVDMTTLTGVATKPNHVALRTTCVFTAGDRTLTLYLDLLGIRDGRFEFSANTRFSPTPAPTEFLQELLATMDDRIAGKVST
jgi:hypothetical protein